MTAVSSARIYTRGGEAEHRAVKAFLRPAGPVFFEDDEAMSDWQPFEPEHDSFAAFSQTDPAQGTVPLDENPAQQASGDMGAEPPAGKFITTDMVWPVQSGAGEELMNSHALSIEQMEARHRLELDELQSRLTKDLSQGFADALYSFETRIAAEIETRLSSLLAPLLTEHAKRASVGAIVYELRSLILAGKMTTVKLSGPAPVISEIKKALGGAGDRIKIGNEVSPDIVIDVDSHIISTRLTEWSDSLTAALT
jgi:hypothetical protein